MSLIQAFHESLVECWDIRELIYEVIYSREMQRNFSDDYLLDNHLEDDSLELV